MVLDVARDDRDALRERIVEGLRCDVLRVTGGVSMGTFAFVPEALTECGATLRIRGLAIKPGRPTVFGTTPHGTLVFGLPGNPVGAFVGFELLARPVLAPLQGRAEAVRREVRARPCRSVQATRDRRSFTLARARVDADGGFEVEPLSWCGFGGCFGMVTANALIVRGPHEAAASAPEAVSIILLDRI